METAGEYAKEASDEFKKKQEELLSETLKKIDIVICSINPRKKSTSDFKENMLDNMNSGSIIYDCSQYKGNTSATKVDEVVIRNGVKIMGESNILNKLAVSASNLYSKNIYNFILNLYDKEKRIKY